MLKTLLNRLLNQTMVSKLGFKENGFWTYLVNSKMPCVHDSLLWWINKYNIPIIILHQIPITLWSTDPGLSCKALFLWLLRVFILIYVIHSFILQYILNATLSFTQRPGWGRAPSTCMIIMNKIKTVIEYEKYSGLCLGLFIFVCVN